MAVRREGSISRVPSTRGVVMPTEESRVLSIGVEETRVCGIGGKTESTRIYMWANDTIPYGRGGKGWPLG
jgi:hypothetical protein